jgi:ribosomal subunit interface protein
VRYVTGGPRAFMMQIHIGAKQFDSGENLPEKVRTRITAAASRHFDRDAEAHVTFAKERIGFRANCHVHLSSGTTMQAHGSGPDAYKAFDAALDRLEQQLRRYTRRRKNHHDGGAGTTRFAR